MPYFYSETNEWLKHWVTQWKLLWSETSSCWFHQNFIHSKDFCCQWLVTAGNLQTIKPFWLGTKSGCKSSCSFSSSKPVNACSKCCRLRNTLWLCQCLPVWPAQVVTELCQRAWPLILQTKPLIVFWKSLESDWQITCRAWTWLKLELSWFTNEL